MARNNRHYHFGDGQVRRIKERGDIVYDFSYSNPVEFGIQYFGPDNNSPFTNNGKQNQSQFFLDLGQGFALMITFKLSDVQMWVTAKSKHINHCFISNLHLVQDIREGIAFDFARLVIYTSGDADLTLYLRDEEVLTIQIGVVYPIDGFLTLSADYGDRVIYHFS